MISSTVRSTSRCCWWLPVFALLVLLPSGLAAQEAEEGIIGIGIAFDDEDFEGPATIEYLYEDVNQDVLDAGDAILEYRGVPVNNGAELYNVILDLPDVAPGEVVDLLLLKPDGTLVHAFPIGIFIAAKTTETTFTDRKCKKTGGNCLCSIKKTGWTCIRRIHSVVGPDGKTLSTSSSCDDGATICPTPPAPKPKKGK